MTALFWRTLKDRKLALVIYTGIATGLVWLYVALYPSIQSQVANFDELMKAYPRELMKAFGLEEGFSFAHLENFLATEQYSMTWPILVVALTVSWGGAMIAGEIEKGTIELLLSQPLSRLKVFVSKYGAALAAMTVFTLVTTLVAIPLAAAYGMDYQAVNYFKVAVIGWLFGGAVLAMAAFFSAWFSEKGKAYFLTVGVVVLMYVLNIVANLKDNLSDLRYGSFFHYFDANAALIHNQIDWPTYAVLGGVMAVFSVAAAVRFVRRDIAT